MTKKFTYVSAAVVAVAVVFFVTSGMLPFQSIVSVDKIEFDGQGDVWVATHVVDKRFEKVRIVANGTRSGDVTAGSNIDIEFIKRDPRCIYPLFPAKKEISFIGLDVVWFELGLPVKNAPTKINLFKGGFSTVDDGILLDSTAAGGATTLNLANSNVKINQLGQLSGGIACPTGGYLLPQYNASGNLTAYKVVSRADFSSWLARVESEINYALIFGGAPDNIVRMVYTSLATTPSQATEFLNLKMHLANITSNSTEFLVELPRVSVNPLLQIQVDGDYADNIIFVPTNPVPKILAAVLRNDSIDRTKQTDFQIIIKNDSTTAGSIQLNPSSDGGIFQFQPLSKQLSFRAGEQKTFVFRAFGARVGANRDVCVTALGAESGISVTSCTKGTVEAIDAGIPEPSPITPVPTPTPTPIPIPLVPVPTPVPADPVDPELACVDWPADGFWVLGFVEKEVVIPQHLFGFIPIQVGEVVETSCVPVYNMAVVTGVAGGLIILALTIVGGAVLWLTGKKGKKNKRKARRTRQR